MRGQIVQNNSRINPNITVITRNEILQLNDKDGKENKM